MLSVLCLILVLIYLYRNHLYNKLDRNKLSHSSYYDVTYGGERKCSGEVLRILRDVGGYKKILVNWRYMENAEAFCRGYHHDTRDRHIRCGSQGLPGLDFR